MFPKQKKTLLFFLCIVSTTYAENLNTLFNQAKSHSPHLPLAKAQVAAARHKLEQAYASNQSKINFTGQEKQGESWKDWHDGIDNTKLRVREYAIQLNKNLYNANINEAIEQNKINYELAKEQYTVSYYELFQQVSEQYFRILMRQSRLDLLHQQKVLVLEQKNLAQASFNAGTVSITDLREAEAKYQTLLSEEQSLKLEILRESNILSELINSLYPLNLQHNSIALDHLPSISIEEKGTLEDLLMKNNHQIKSAKWNVDIAKIEISKAKATKYPTLNFTAKLERNINSQESAYLSQQNGWDTLYGLELNVPLYNSENQYKIKEQYALLDKAQYELQLTIQKQKNQFYEAFYSTLAAITKTRGLKDAEQSSFIAWQANKRAYEVGMRVNADVLEAQTKYFETRQERSNAWYEAWLNYLKLQTIVATLAEQDIKHIDHIFYVQQK